MFNTAIALGRLGGDVGLFSGVSTDALGEKLDTTLRQNNVSTDLLVRSNLPTTLAMVHVQNGNASYSFYDENSAGRSVTIADLPKIPGICSALFFGGISLVARPAADAYAALLQREHADRVIMLDPNIRPAFVTDERSYRDRLEGMMRCSDIVKVSDEDLDWIVPAQGTLADKAKALRQTGPSVVIVTQGARGVTAFFGDDSLSVPALNVEVADTVGAGDTFNAGLLAGLRDMGCLTKPAISDMSAKALHHALSFGSKAASITVTRTGANPPWAKEIAGSDPEAVGAE